MVDRAFLKKITDRICDGDGEQSLYECLLSEREYQDMCWNVQTTASKGSHTHLEFMTYIERYIDVAIEESLKPEPEASNASAEVLRKVVGMAVASMEQHQEDADVDDCWDSLVSTPIETIAESLICVKAIVIKGVQDFIHGENSKADLFYNMHQIFVIGSLAMLHTRCMPNREHGIA